MVLVVSHLLDLLIVMDAFVVISAKLRWIDLHNLVCKIIDLDIVIHDSFFNSFWHGDLHDRIARDLFLAILVVSYTRLWLVVNRVTLFRDLVLTLGIRDTCDAWVRFGIDRDDLFMADHYHVSVLVGHLCTDDFKLALDKLMLIGIAEIRLCTNSVRAYRIVQRLCGIKLVIKFTFWLCRLSFILLFSLNTYEAL